MAICENEPKFYGLPNRNFDRGRLLNRLYHYAMPLGGLHDLS